MLPPLATTGIGSLPHTTTADALDLAFAVDIPYVPQLPARDAREFMLVQATQGVPGIVADAQGVVTLDLAEWKSQATTYDEKLTRTLTGRDWTPFLPSASYLACWEPFLERIRTQRPKFAKVQTAGPMTLEWMIRTTSGDILPPTPLVHIARTILARALAMVDAVAKAGATPVVFVDEPGLYAFSRHQPHHIAMREELRAHILFLKKAGAIVGLHSCSDTDWSALFDLGLHVLAVDARLSLRSMLRHTDSLVSFVAEGGQLALGVVPTNLGDAPLATPEVLWAEVESEIRSMERYFPTRAPFFSQLIAKSLLTPACGLALLSVDTAGDVVRALRDIQAKAQTGAKKSTSRSVRSHVAR